MTPFTIRSRTAAPPPVPDQRATPPVPPAVPVPAAPAAAPVPLVPAALEPGSDREREAALAGLFQAHYPALLRLAVLLGADDAEDIVAEAYYQLYRRWRKLRGNDAALAYLRSVVCNLTRMRLRHLQVVRKHAGPREHGVRLAESSAETEALLHDDQRALVSALKELPARQREALVLRHWLGLREAEIAEAMGISCGAVKSHTSRGMSALTRAMEERR